MKQLISIMLAAVLLLPSLLLAGCGGATGQISLAVKDADLSGSTAVLENNPQNIGGWETGGTVEFTIEIKDVAEEGWYDVEMEYSKEGSVEGIELVLEAGDDADGMLVTWLDATADNGDWSKYEKKTVGSIYLTTETKTMQIYAYDEFYGNHVINLRGITLQLVEKEKRAAPSEY